MTFLLKPLWRPIFGRARPSALGLLLLLLLLLLLRSLWLKATTAQDASQAGAASGGSTAVTSPTDVSHRGLRQVRPPSPWTGQRYPRTMPTGRAGEGAAHGEAAPQAPIHPKTRLPQRQTVLITARIMRLG